MMATRTASASWNPAFMPNSMTDIDETNPQDPKELRIHTDSTTYNHPDTVRDTVSSGNDASSDVDSAEDSTPDDDDHAEITSLRHALSTSLASPGGVEMADTPWHNEDTQPEVREEEKEDFPSNGPSSASKHLSTMSFARTVSDDVNWGEEDEVDQEWNLHRSDADPFEFMAKTDRTNSFPAVPPARAHGMVNEVELPHSQAEEIMKEVEVESGNLFRDGTGNLAVGFFSKREGSVETDDFLLNFGSEGHPASANFSGTLGGEVRAPGVEESEARYEEGLPLVQSVDDNEGKGRSQSGLNGFEIGDAHDEDDFFAHVSKTDEEDVPVQQLGRKSTMQVIDSLDFQHQQTHDDIMEEEEEAARITATAGQNDVPTAPSETDLAAKWAAALDDEFLDDDDDELLPDDDEPTESSGMDPSALFSSDEEGFLEDTDEPQSANTFAASTPNQNGGSTGFEQRPGRSGSASRYTPAGLGLVTPGSSSTYAPAAPFLTDLSRTAASPTVSSPYTAAVSSFQAPQTQRPELPKAQSFADKSRGGYSSPYDLPMDIVKPRKRPSMQQMNRANAAPANIAPPRSSSMYAQPPPSATQTSPFTQGSPQTPTVPGQSPGIKTVRKSQSGFFEDLPMSAKPRLAPRHSSGLASPALSPYGAPHSIPPPPMGSAPPQAQHNLQIQPPPQNAGLVAPERVSPYASLPTGNASMPPVASRYSPAPPQPSQQMVSPQATQSRYSPAPTAPRQQTANYSISPQLSSQPTPPLPHQPRTSSPLAHFERHSEPRSQNLNSESRTIDRRSSSSGHESGLRFQHLPPTQEVNENGQLSPPAKSYGELQSRYNQPMSPPRAMRSSQTPPPPQNLASRLVNSPPKKTTTNYAPQQASYGLPPVVAPPKRSQTQSPGSHFGGPRSEMSTAVPYQRPASVELPTSPRVASYPTVSTTTRPRGFSQGLNYIAPTDGRELDTLQRWRGAPVFAWGLGGTIITSFPKDVPRYAMNQTLPMVVRSPGEVKVRSIKDVDPLQSRLSSFPGPLKGKSKKKDVLTWLASGTQLMEQDAMYLRTAGILSHEDKRTEERILLWKILGVFIENDGALEGSPVVEKAVRSILSPGLDDTLSAAPLYATGADLSGISQSSTAIPRAEPVDPSAVDLLRKHLLRGEREKAVWEAVDKRLWAHAMIISNTVSKDLYKRVAQEFVQKEVKNIGNNTESLAALYEVFAGNFEESVDELVPPSARAGFQMVSTTTASGPSKGALDGLDRWRETLGLVLSNRSTDDIQALNALGKLLSGYGRAEAAHICFLFARSLSIFGGVDDPQASIVLVGSDHLRQPYDFDRELEPILLSEVFEYGMALAAPSSALIVSSPHLSIYKLQHAKVLAEYGYRDKALQYCDAIESSMTSQTRRSPYHHSLLLAEVEDLGRRLRRSPKDDTGSWISKPSIDKAKGTVWATFNKFVSGEGDESSDGAGANGGDIGPFARISGGTPTISRSPSNSEIFGMNGPSAMPITKASSRYAPGAGMSQESMSYGSQARSSLEERSSGEFRRYEPQRQMSDYRPDAPPLNAPNSYTPQTSSSYTPQGNPYDSPAFNPQTPVTELPSTNIFSSPQPIAGFDGIQQPNTYVPDSSYNQSQPSSYDSRSNTFGPASGGYQPFTSNNYDQSSSNGYEPPSSGGYEPPSSGYEPPSYEPASMGDEADSPIETLSKKKSFMYDDDDDIPALRNPSASGEKTKAEKDREADEAFRKAAEADAQKAKEAPVKKGWGLGGWFGGGAKKDADTSSQPQPTKAIRAKLGEESSFVYDPELKRWVDKKAGAEQVQAKHSTPPPPRAMGPPRTASVGPTSQPRIPLPADGPPQQRAVSESSSPPSNGHPPLQRNGGLAPPGMMRTPSNGSLQGPPSLNGSGPSSRPGTAMSTRSNASSIEDLLGPPMPRKGSGAMAKAAKKKKGNRYIDVMDKPAA